MHRSNVVMLYVDYVDLLDGNHSATLMLSHIVSCYLPSAHTGVPEARVLKTEGGQEVYWFAKSQVINRIRTFVKRSPAEKVPVDINGVIRDTIALVGGEFIRNQMLLRTDLAPDISPVIGDRIQLQQVILNLLMNAVDATNARSQGPREILLTSKKQGLAEIIVEIRDSGAGIDPQTVDQLFDPFFTTKPGGMGMGLSISRSLIEAHGGRLWANPNDTCGATFQFSLPAIMAA